MNTGKVVSLRGTKEARELLDSLSGKELQNRTRRATRKGAAIFRAEVRSEARSRSDIPNSFAKTATRGHRTPVGTSIGPTSPLLNIFEEGAGAHTIAPGAKSGKLVLSGKAGDRWRSQDFVASDPVSHPGMGARPLIGPIFDAKEEEASNAAMDELLRGIH